MIRAACAVLVLLASSAACAPGGASSDRLAKFDLSPEQRSVAEAFLAGFAKESGISMHRSRDYFQAVCYAKTVEMPASLEKAHKLYLENYVEADKDYYAYFKSHGISEKNAERMGNIYKSTFDACQPANQIRQKLNEG